MPAKKDLKFNIGRNASFPEDPSQWGVTVDLEAFQTL
jgi:hypothetical protein